MKPLRSILQEIRYRASLLVLALVRFLPYVLIITLFRFFAVLAFFLDPFHRKVAGIQMRSALGFAHVRLLVLKVFMNQAEILVDTVRYAYMSDEEIRNKVKVEGKQHLDTALSSGRGIMMITGHIGNWEIISHIPRVLGIQFCVMADVRKDKRLESIVDRIRSRSGATILPPKGKALMLIKELKKGHTIGMVVDNRSEKKDGLLCNVFGMPAPTNPAPAFIAIKGNALVLPVYAIKQRGSYIIRFSKALDAGTFGIGETAMRHLSDFMQSWVSSVVKEHPHQWFWLYSRWVKRSDMRRIIKKGLDFREYVLRQAEINL
ncbi:MAG: lysophospholipid acyltransferase family protein [Desulfomonilia bacterium]|jgi:KDO2-lipid IV(A) lauroyltransferase